jgi:hypothetical protein
MPTSLELSTIPTGEDEGVDPDALAPDLLNQEQRMTTTDVGTEQSKTMGPVSYLIVEFPGNKMTGEGFSTLVDLVDQGLIRILDLLFVSRAVDGSMDVIDLQDVDGDGEFDLSIFEGVSAGLLDHRDLADAASVVEPGSSAGILIFENRWATPFVQALRGSDGQLVAAGYIPHDTVLASLDATDQ